MQKSGVKTGRRVKSTIILGVYIIYVLFLSTTLVLCELIWFTTLRGYRKISLTQSAVAFSCRNVNIKQLTVQPCIWLFRSRSHWLQWELLPVQCAVVLLLNPQKETRVGIVIKNCEPEMQILINNCKNVLNVCINEVYSFTCWTCV